MDPASAIGVASAAITFLDFTIALCKLAGEVSSSENGATAYNARLESEIKRLKQTTNDVFSNRLPVRLSSAVDESISASTDLLQLLERIRKTRDKTKSGTFKAVYMSLRHRSNVAALEQRVDKCRRLVVEVMSQETFKKTVALHDISETGFKSLDNRATDILEAIKNGDDITVRLLDSSSISQQRLDDKVSALESVLRSRSDSLISKIDDIAQKVLDMAKPNLKEAFMDSLFFPQFRQREQDVSDPCTTTFEWFFDPQGGTDTSAPCAQGSEPNPWQSFPRWLEDPDSSKQYWLSGKAGSGKSTLMAHVVRNQARIERHLNQWLGSKHLCILSFFLFRAGSRLQTGLLYLLRSLIYQLIDQIPAMQEVLMARFLPSGSNTRIAEWPVSTLKKMLSFAIEIADDHKFFVMIDGLDEFQSSEYLGNDGATAVDLMVYLYEIQRPAHVKLCVSSRPELCIVDRYPSFLETKLSRLNREDIRKFVCGRMSEFGGLKNRDSLSYVICDRADGMFMWSVFALREIEEGHCFKESYSQLMTRLEGMGSSLETAIAHMLKSIARPHKTRVAFYLQALGSWVARGHCTRRDTMSVGLIAASRSNFDTLSTSDFVDLCREEEQALRKFSRGLVEVNKAQYLRPLDPTKTHLVVKRQDKVKSGVTSRAIDPYRYCDDNHPWTAVPNSGHLAELHDHCASSITPIHRSAHDFFFLEAEAAHVNSASLLTKWNDPTEVPKALQRGLWKLLYLEPVLQHEKLSSRNARIEANLARRYIAILHHTADAPFSQQERTVAVDQLLSAMRKELFSLFAGDSSYVEEREHLPGDIFFRETLNGCLQLVGDLSCNPHSGMKHEDMLALAAHESEFWIECSQHETMDCYFHDRLRDLHHCYFGHLVLASMAQKSDRLEAKHLELVLQCIHSSTERMMQRQQAVKFPWLSWLKGRSTDCASTYPQSSKKVRISMRGWTLGQSHPTCFQWTPRWQIEDNDRFETEHVSRLITQLFVAREQPSRMFETVSRVIKPWNVWMTVAFETEPEPKTEPDAFSSGFLSDPECIADHLFQTRLFVSLDAACASSANSTSQQASSFDSPKVFQVAHISEKEDGTAEVLYNHIVTSPMSISPQTEFWGMLDPSIDITPYNQLWELLSYPLQGLEGTVVETIIADIQLSTQLNHAQKAAMVEGVERWPIFEPDA